LDASELEIFGGIFGGIFLKQKTRIKQRRGLPVTFRLTRPFLLPGHTKKNGAVTCPEKLGIAPSRRRIFYCAA
jgi:hypothetical protein